MPEEQQKTQKNTLLKQLKAEYQPLEAGLYLPKQDAFAQAPEKIVLRETVVDMEDLNDRLAAQAEEWKHLEIYADVVVFPVYSERYGEFAFKLGSVGGQRVTIFARSIQLPDGYGMFINYNPQTQLSIYSAEIVGGDLSISGLAGTPRNNAVISLPTDGVGVHIDTSSTQIQAIDSIPSDLVAHNTPAFWLLESTFNLGSSLLYDNPALAGKHLAWVGLTAGFGDDIETTHLALNAANLSGYLAQSMSKIPFVPELSPKLYKEVTEDYLAPAAAYEQNFNDSMAQASQQKDFSGYVAANKDYFTDQSEVELKLIDQMRADVASAEKILDQNSHRIKALTKHDGAIQVSRKAFKAGIDAYREQKQQEAIIGVCTAIFEVGASLGAMAAGNEAAAGSAVKGAQATANAVKVAAETASKMKKLMDAIKKIAKMVKKLIELVKKLKAAQEAIEKLTKANDIKSSDYTKGLEHNPDDDEIFDNAYWQEFKINVTGLLSPYAEEIPTSKDYLEQLQYLSVYGEAVYANTLKLTELRHKLFKLVLEQKVTQNQQERLEKLVSDEEQEAERLEKAKVIYYQNLLRVKGRLIFYMDQHIAAYRYWSVSPELPAHLMPSLQDSVGKLGEKLADIDKNRIEKLKSFNPHPSDMNLTFKIDNKLMMEQFLKKRELSFVVPPEHEKFVIEEHVEAGHPAKLFGRVRVNWIRAFLNDEAIKDPNTTIKLEVSSSPHYLDRYRDSGQLEYISTPTETNFEYKLDNKNDPVGGGKLPREFEDSYFEPTAFTEWKIKLMNNIDDIDAKALRYVELNLRGVWNAYRVS